jgi:hypothetical protein
VIFSETIYVSNLVKCIDKEKTLNKNYVDGL